MSVRLVQYGGQTNVHKPSGRADGKKIKRAVDAEWETHCGGGKCGRGKVTGLLSVCKHARVCV